MKATENVELKRLMNARLWQCVLDQKGGVPKMAELTGFKAQTFYNMRDNKTFPATDTIATIKQKIPTLSIELLYSLDENTDYALKPGVFVGEAKTTIDGLLAKIEQININYVELEAKYNDLLDRFNGLIETMATKMKMSFPESGSHPTADGMYGFAFAIEGFVQAENEVKIIALNSLDNVRKLNSRPLMQA